MKEWTALKAEAESALQVKRYVRSESGWVGRLPEGGRRLMAVRREVEMRTLHACWQLRFWSRSLEWALRTPGL